MDGSLLREGVASGVCCGEGWPVKAVIASPKGEAIQYRDRFVWIAHVRSALRNDECLAVGRGLSLALSRGLSPSRRGLSRIVRSLFPAV
jgi:hypothetical protein